MKKLPLITTALAGGLLYLTLGSHSYGVQGYSTAGCTCHSQSTATLVSVTSNIPGTGYVQGNTYQLTLTVSNSSYTAAGCKAGFDLTVNIGSLTAITNTALNGSTELYHTTPKAMSSGSASWTFDWTAPSSGTTALAVNVSGNAVNGNGNEFGDAYNTGIFNFNAAVVASAPTITGVSSTGVSSTGATINGNVNANNASTTTTVEYGTTISYGSSMATTPGTVNGSTATAVSAQLASLSSSTLYHYRIKAVNTSGTTYSPDNTFTTLAATSAPTISGLNTTGITSSGATIGATVNANNAPTNLTVELGLTTSYGTTVTPSPGSVNGTTATPISASVTGLTPNTTYHYRVKGVNSVGTTYSADSTFTTAVAVGLPSVSNMAATAVTATGATISASVNANNGNTAVTLEYGTTTTYGNMQNMTPANVSGNVVTPVSHNLTGLTPNTLYHYRIVGVNSAGTTNGPDATFTTSPTGVPTIINGGFTVYPNPANGAITVSTNSLVEVKAVRIFDLSGKFINVKFTNAGSQQFRIDLGNVPAGSYHLILETNKGFMHQPLVKTN